MKDREGGGKGGYRKSCPGWEPCRSAKDGLVYSLWAFSARFVGRWLEERC
jgi:hypothetical protein